ncbi:MAG: nucleotide exchange factor GrpE [Planctomycetota bacterium]
MMKKKTKPAPEEANDHVDTAVTEDDGVASDEATTTIDEQVAAMQSERDEAIEGRMRALADFANFQRRANENEKRAREEGLTTVIRMLLPALDNLDLALAQDPETVTVDQVFQGVTLVRTDMDKLLQDCGLSRIEPFAGDMFDPGPHEAMYRQPTDEFPPDRVVSVLKPGYTLGDVVLRAAQVAVSAEMPEEQVSDADV